MSEASKPTCGRCGVYRHLHPTRAGCEKARLSFWWDRHFLWRHIAAGVWLRLDDRRRMDIAHRIWSRNERLCWCDFVDAALLDDKRGDWGCGCDVPLPVGVREPDGRCYCPTPSDLRTTDQPDPEGA